MLKWNARGTSLKSTDLCASSPIRLSHPLSERSRSTNSKHQWHRDASPLLRPGLAPTEAEVPRNQQSSILTNLQALPTEHRAPGYRFSLLNCNSTERTSFAINIRLSRCHGSTGTEQTPPSRLLNKLSSLPLKFFSIASFLVQHGGHFDKTNQDFV